MRGPRDHFSDELWSDFVRKAAEPAAEEAMRAHLLAGCERCASAVDLMTAVVQFAANEATNAVPRELTEKVRALFEPRSAGAAWAEKLERLAAALIWERRPGWAPQGVRSVAGGGRRVLYRAGDYSVDLNVERSAGEPGEIIGQIVNESDRQEVLEGILVQVVSTGQALVQTATNRFGEFIIEYPATKNPVLRLALRHRGQRIDLPLNS